MAIDLYMDTLVTLTKLINKDGDCVCDKVYIESQHGIKFITKQRFYQQISRLLHRRTRTKLSSENKTPIGLSYADYNAITRRKRIREKQKINPFDPATSSHEVNSH